MNRNESHRRKHASLKRRKHGNVFSAFPPPAHTKRARPCARASSRLNAKEGMKPGGGDTTGAGKKQKQRRRVALHVRVVISQQCCLYSQGKSFT